MEYRLQFQMVPRIVQNEQANIHMARWLWKMLRNFPAWTEHKLMRTEMSQISRRISSNLNQYGYEISSVKELGLKAEFEDALVEANPIEGSEIGHRVPFNTNWLVENKILRDSLEDYCGVKLKAWQGGRIVHSKSSKIRKGNARWHVDIEDFHVLKVFVFLSEVTLQNGPTQFLPETHPKGRLAPKVVKMLRCGMIGEFADHTGEIAKSFVGKPGTVLIFDSRGIHRGGFVEKGSRDVLFQAFMAPNWIHRREKFRSDCSVTYKRPLLSAMSNSSWEKLTDWITW